VIGVCLLLATVTAPRAVRAQEHLIGDLVEGDSVRLRMRGSMRVHASMLGFRGDTLLLRVQGLAGSWPVSQIDLVSLEQHADRNSREGFRHGATLGLATGLFLGAISGVVVSFAMKDGVGVAGYELTNRTFRWGGLGAVFGALGGGFLGGAHPGTGWVGLALPTR
jgi:hypothetical protein